MAFLTTTVPLSNMVNRSPTLKRLPGVGHWSERKMGIGADGIARIAHQRVERVDFRICGRPVARQVAVPREGLDEQGGRRPLAVSCLPTSRKCRTLAG